MTRLSAVALVLLLAAAATPAAAILVLPDRLTFGYAEEGKVNASRAACTAYVRDTVEWDETKMQEAIAQVCSARKRHVDAYEQIQRAYTALRDKLFDPRIEAAQSVLHLQSMVKACIDHKLGLRPDGHNIAIDIIPNEIAADCLSVGTKMLTDERAWFERGAVHGAGP